MFGKLGEIAIGVACELLTIRDPWEKWFPPEVIATRSDESGREVIEVRAANYRDVGRVTEGTTQAGDVTEVHTHIGCNEWEISAIDWEV